MKFACWMCLFMGISTANAAAQERLYQQGAVVRMRTTDCIAPSHRVLSALSGAPPTTTGLCSEYTLVAESVVYVILGKSSGQLIPLADNLRFRIKKSELLVHIDGEKRESGFLVTEMQMRTDWEDGEMQRRSQSGSAHGRAGNNQQQPLAD